MIQFHACYPSHVRLVKPQASQRAEADYHSDIADEWVRESVALSAWVDDTCVGVAGYRLIWGTRAACWALLSEDAGPVMLPIARRMRLMLGACPANRLEMTVRGAFLPGHRLAGLLGFKCETPDGMRGFFPDGETAYLFARVKTWE